MKFIILLMLLCACSSKTIKAPVTDREFLFPYGEYQHQVQVTAKKAEGHMPKNIEFQGAFLFKKDFVRLVALSPFGTTLFRVEENLITHEIKMEVFYSAMKPYEPKMKEFYILTRDLLTIPLRNIQSSERKVLRQNEKAFPLELQMKTEKGTVQLLIPEYDVQDIPEEIQLISPEFQMRVKVVSYDL